MALQKLISVKGGIMGLQCMSPITENKTVLSDFKNFEIKDKQLIDSFTKPWKLDCSDLSFANMFIWGADAKFQYTIYEDVLYIKLNFQMRCPVRSTFRSGSLRCRRRAVPQ